MIDKPGYEGTPEDVRYFPGGLIDQMIDAINHNTTAIKELQGLVNDMSENEDTFSSDMVDMGKRISHIEGQHRTEKVVVNQLTERVNKLSLKSCINAPGAGRIELPDNGIVGDYERWRREITAVINDYEKRIEVLEAKYKANRKWIDTHIRAINATGDRLVALEDHTHGIYDSEIFYGLSGPKPLTPRVDDILPEHAEKLRKGETPAPVGNLATPEEIREYLNPAQPETPKVGYLSTPEGIQSWGCGAQPETPDEGDERCRSCQALYTTVDERDEAYDEIERMKGELAEANARINRAGEIATRYRDIHPEGTEAFLIGGLIIRELIK